MKSFLICVLTAASVAFAYQASSTLGSIEGQVVNPDTGAPVRNASVVVNSAGGQPIRPGQPPGQYFSNNIEADEQGKFSIADLPAGSYQIRAQRRGVQNYMGNGTTVFLGEGQQLKSLVVKMTTQSVVSGKVLDQYGEPVQGAQVMLLRPTFMNGQSQWNTVANAQTSDLGEYRIPVTAPGIYVVSASLRDYLQRSPLQALPEKPELSYVPTYYPSTIDPARATRITAGSGGEVRAIDIKLQRLPTVRIRGHVVDPAPTPNRMPMVTLRPRNGVAAPNMGLGSTSFTGNGDFEISSVVPGSYNLIAQKYLTDNNMISSTTGSLIAILPVEVGDKSIDGVQLKLAGGKNLQGKVVREGVAGNVSLRIMAMTVDGMYFGQMPSAINVTGASFTLQNVLPGRYTISVSSNGANSYLKSVRYGGKEIPPEGVDLSTGAAIEVTMAADGGRIEGTVIDAAGKPVANSLIVLRPREGPQPAYNLNRTNPNGEFRIPMLRPGEYQVYAWADATDQSTLQSPELLKSFESRSQIVKVEPGATSTVALTAIVPPGVVPHAPHAKANIAGRIVSSTTGLPIARASVTLQDASNFAGALHAESDEQGRFDLRAVEPGFYRVSVEHQGFITQQYPESRLGVVDRLVAGEGQQIRDMVVKLAPQGVIAGKVLDDHGAPMEGVRVYAYRKSYFHGQAQFRSFSVLTDDLGEYRIPALPAGSYTVAAQRSEPLALTTGPLPEKPDSAWPVTWYPAATDFAQTKTITVTAGVVLDKVNIGLRKTPLYRIRGKIVNPNGPTPRAYSLTMTPRNGQRQPSVGSLQFTRNGEGTFEIFNVVPGSYLLLARLTDGGQQRTATLPIDVKDRSVDGVTLQLAAPRDVFANVTLDDKPYTNSNGLFLMLSMDGTNGGFAQGMFDGTRFKFQNVSAAPATLDVSGLPPDCSCYVKSITYGGTEIPESGAVVTGGAPLAIALGSKASVVEGTVVDRQGAPVPNAIVAIVTGGKAKIGEADGYGKFYWANNAPGEVKLLAWQDVDASALEAPGATQPFEASAQVVQLADSARQTVQLRAIPAAPKQTP